MLTVLWLSSGRQFDLLYILWLSIGGQFDLLNVLWLSSGGVMLVRTQSNNQSHLIDFLSSAPEAWRPGSPEVPVTFIPLTSTLTIYQIFDLISYLVDQIKMD